jgi:hypothetical protein
MADDNIERRRRIPRTAKGERPRNFSDPAIDTLVGIVMSLTAELSVLRDRCRTLEQQLEGRGVLRPGEIDAAELSAAELEIRARDRAEFLERVLRAARADLDELSTDRIARPVEEIIRDLADRKF